MTDILSQAQQASRPVSEGAVRLSDWGVMRARGEESAKFLHSQLTQDIALQTSAQARLAGFCTAKGRLLATMVAVKPDDQTVLMALPAEVLPATLKRLSMFVLRAKCKLDDASPELAVWGLSGATSAAWLGDSAPATVWTVGRSALADGREARSVRLPDDGNTPRFLLLQPADAPAPALPALDESTWRGQDASAGLAWVRGATVEQFVPQMLNLELIGGVNFQKGCYPGQEIVARSQYRGTIKRRTHLFALPDGSTAAPGQEIFHSEDPEQPAGLVAGTGRGADAELLLAEVKLAALASGTLHLGAADGVVLTPGPCPTPSENRNDDDFAADGVPLAQQAPAATQAALELYVYYRVHTDQRDAALAAFAQARGAEPIRLLHRHDHDPVFQTWMEVYGPTLADPAASERRIAEALGAFAQGPRHREAFSAFAGTGAAS